MPAGLDAQVLFFGVLAGTVSPHHMRIVINNNCHAASLYGLTHIC